MNTHPSMMQCSIDCSSRNTSSSRANSVFLSSSHSISINSSFKHIQIPTQPHKLSKCLPSTRTRTPSSSPPRLSRTSTPTLLSTATTPTFLPTTVTVLATAVGLQNPKSKFVVGHAVYYFRGTSMNNSYNMLTSSSQPPSLVLMRASATSSPVPMSPMVAPPPVLATTETSP